MAALVQRAQTVVYRIFPCPVMIHNRIDCGKGSRILRLQSCCVRFMNVSECPDKPGPEPFKRRLGFQLQIFRPKQTPEHLKRHTGQIMIAPRGILKTEAVKPVVKAADQLTEYLLLLRRDHLVFRAAFPVLPCLQRLKNFQKLFEVSEVRSDALLFRFFRRFGYRFFCGRRFRFRQADIRLPLLLLAAGQYQQKRQQRGGQFFHLFLLFVRKLMFSPSS